MILSSILLKIKATNFLVLNWSGMTLVAQEPIQGNGDLYFVGALIALSQAIFTACNNIIIAKIVSYCKK